MSLTNQNPQNLFISFPSSTQTTTKKPKKKYEGGYCFSNPQQTQTTVLILKSSTNTNTHSRLFFSSSIEIDHLGDAMSSSSSDGEFKALTLKRLDDLIHSIIVQKSTPDWLPFILGSSFWVPPRPNFLEWVELEREGKSKKEIVGQERRVKSKGKKSDFGFGFEFCGKIWGFLLWLWLGLKEGEEPEKRD